MIKIHKTETEIWYLGKFLHGKRWANNAHLQCNCAPLNLAEMTKKFLLLCSHLGSINQRSPSIKKYEFHESLFQVIHNHQTECTTYPAIISKLWVVKIVSHDNQSVLSLHREPLYIKLQILRLWRHTKKIRFLRRICIMPRRIFSCMSMSIMNLAKQIIRKVDYEAKRERSDNFKH